MDIPQGAKSLFRLREMWLLTSGVADLPSGHVPQIHPWF